MTDAEMTEKRRYERHPVAFSVTVTRLMTSPDPSAKTEFQGRLTDLSRGGARLVSREMLHPNENVRVALADEKAEPKLDCRGLVRWSLKVTGGYEAGIQFTDVAGVSSAPAEK